MSSNRSISVTFLPNNMIANASHGETLLEVALRAKVEVAHSCGGNGTCGTCRVYIESGLESLGERNEIEMEFAEQRNFAANERLSCQTVPVANLIVRPPTKSIG